MIQSFENAATEDIFNGKDTKAARKACPRNLWTIAARKLDQLDSVVLLGELGVPPGNRLEASFRAIAKDSTASGSTTDIVFASSGWSPAPAASKSSITTDRPNQEDLMIRIPTHRPPTHPGEMLLEEFLIPSGLTQRELATAIHVPYQRVNEIARGRRGVTPGTGLRLAKFFGTSADFWLNLQLRWDLYHAQRKERAALTTIRPRAASGPNTSAVHRGA